MSIPLRLGILLPTQIGMESSLLDIVLGAGLLVQLLLLGLLGMSVFTWAIVFFKRKVLAGAEEEAAQYEDAYQQAETLKTAYRSAKTTYRDTPTGRVLAAGYEEAREERHGREDPGASRRVERALETAIGAEIARLEKRLPFLAITGSTAPFIGLFGTVWGIMKSFRDIGNLRSADLAVVAPGIAEALIATAVGLFAAIPAVMAYNVFLTRIKAFRRGLEAFADHALSRIEREWPAGDAGDEN